MSEISPGLATELETLQRKHAEYPEGRYFVPLANARRKAGDLDRAEALLRDGLEIHPDYLSAHIVLGRCLEDRGNGREAEEQFQRVLSRDPQNLVALQHLGEIAARDGRRDDAARWYRELIGADPMNDGARARLMELEAGEPQGVVADEIEDEDQRWEGEGGLALDREALSESGPAQPERSEKGSNVDGGRFDSFAGEEGDEALQGDEVRKGREPEWVAAEGRSEEDRDDLGPYGFVEPGEAETDRDAHREDEPWAAPLEVEDDAVGMGPADADVPHPDEEVEVDVVTETIASIYARQGLYERAAAVYRQLLDQRGEEPHLIERLAEVERALAERDAPEAEKPGADFEVGEEEGWSGSGEGKYAFADSFSHGFPGTHEGPEISSEESDAEVWAPGEQEHEESVGKAPVDVDTDGFEGLTGAETAAGDEGLEQEPVATDDAGESVPIGSYLRALLAWTSSDQEKEGESNHPAAETHEIPADSEPWGGTPSDDAEAGRETEDTFAASERGDDDATSAPVSTEDLIDDLPDPPAPSAEERADDEPQSQSDEAEIGLTAPLEEEPEPAVESGPRSDHAEFSGEDPYDGDDAARNEPASPDRREAASAHADETRASGSPDDAPSVDDERAEEAESDDDLQSFQAWLKSLKR